MHSQVTEGVVEHGIRNEAARIVWLAIRSDVERIAVTGPDVANTPRLALQLFDIHGPDISAVILVVVGKAVVEENRRIDLVGNGDGQNADAGILGYARRPCVVLPSMSPLGRRRHWLFEHGRVFVGGYIGERRRYGSIKVCLGERCGGIAVCVINRDLLYLVEALTCHFQVDNVGDTPARWHTAVARRWARK